jgi:hypothetical protein
MVSLTLGHISVAQKPGIRKRKGGGFTPSRMLGMRRHTNPQTANHPKIMIRKKI